MASPPEAPSPHTVRWLRAHPDPDMALAALEAAFDIGWRRHAQLPHLVQLRYRPRSAPKDHPVVRECRGLILDTSADWAVVAYPLERFHHAPAGGGEVLDWRTAVVSEKLDGSVATLYRHRGAWHVASSRRPDGSGLLGTQGAGPPMALSELFWRIWHAQGHQLPDDALRCYVFELCAARHPIVIHHEADSLHLLGVRRLDTLAEEPPEGVAARLGWRCVPRLELWGASASAGERRAAVAAHVSSLDGSRREGVVVRDAGFRRIKWKSPGYLARQWRFPVRGTGRELEAIRYLEVILAHEVEELVASCPLQRPHVERVQRRVDALIEQIDTAHAALLDQPTDRDFARAAEQTPFAPLLFARRRAPGVPTLRHLEQARLRYVLGLLERLT